MYVPVFLILVKVLPMILKKEADINPLPGPISIIL